MEQAVRIPYSILNHPQLSPGAKRLWAVLLTLSFPRRVRMAELMALTGATRKTVVQQLEGLRQQGLLLYEPGRWKAYEIQKLLAQDPGETLPLPLELIHDQRVSASGLLVWASLSEGGAKARAPETTVRRHLLNLKETGWLSERGQPQNPFALERQQELHELKQWLAKLQLDGCSYGQALMTAMVTLAVDDDDFVIESEKKYLTNPTTDNLLRYDLHWPGHRRAFEFHGPQHYGLTKKYPNREQFLVRRQRDLLKLGLSQERGILVEVIAYTDLNWARVHEATAGLPRRDLTSKQHLVRELADLAKEHGQTLGNIKVTPVE